MKLAFATMLLAVLLFAQGPRPPYPPPPPGPVHAVPAIVLNS